MRTFPPWRSLLFQFGVFFLGFALSLVLFASVAKATITINSVSGFSSIATDEEGYKVVSGAISSSCSSTTTCDTCTTGLNVCSLKAIGPTTEMVINFTTSTTTTITSSLLVVKVDETNVTLSRTPVINGTTVEVSVPWSDICRIASNDSSCAASDFSTTVTVGIKTSTSTDSTTTDTNYVKVKARSLASSTLSATYTNCPTDDTAVDSTEGYCYFKPFRGDEKVFADELRTGADYPSTGVSGISYKGPVFFYEQQASGETDEQTVARISNASDYFLLLDPAVDNRIDGLSNEVRYCFIMANQDETGIISRFTPVSGFSTTDKAALCATPSQVVGLLDDKSCFVATAAFGSQMATEVQTFRDFRDKYLLTNPWGVKFVKFYYAHSPKYANYIAQSETLRAAARGVLWVPLMMSKVSLKIGVIPAILLFGSFISGCLVLLIGRPRRKNREEIH